MADRHDIGPGRFLKDELEWRKTHETGRNAREAERRITDDIDAGRGILSWQDESRRVHFGWPELPAYWRALEERKFIYKGRALVFENSTVIFKFWTIPRRAIPFGPIPFGFDPTNPPEPLQIVGTCATFHPVTPVTHDFIRSPAGQTAPASEPPLHPPEPEKPKKPENPKKRGRRTAASEIRAEAERQLNEELDKIPDRLYLWARKLAKQHIKIHPDGVPVKPKTIEDQVRDIHREVKRRKTQKDEN